MKDYIKYLFNSFNPIKQNIELFWVLIWLIALIAGVKRMIETEVYESFVLVALCIFVQWHKYKIFKSMNNEVKKD